MVKYITFNWIIITWVTGTVLCQDVHQEINIKPRLFIEGPDIDFDYLRREVTFVDYVRDREQSDIFLFVTRRRSGSIGREYTMIFNGRGIFEGINDTLLYYTRGIDSNDEERTGFVRTMKRGLFPYINKTRLAKNIDINYNELYVSNETDSKVDDPWDYWVFRIELQGWINGESQREGYSLKSAFNAERITDDWKLKFSSSIGYQQDEYSFEDEKIFNISRNKFLGTEIIKSAGDHFGIGLFSYYYSSTYKNIDHQLAFYPGAEYSFYPYSESSHQKITIAYRVGYDWNYYIEETIFNKWKEALVKQRMDFGLEFKEQWGEINLDINYIWGI